MLSPVPPELEVWDRDSKALGQFRAGTPMGGWSQAFSPLLALLSWTWILVVLRDGGTRSEG
jgi:hypothetical protein